MTWKFTRKTIYGLNDIIRIWTKCSIDTSAMIEQIPWNITLITNDICVSLITSATSSWTFFTERIVSIDVKWKRAINWTCVWCWVVKIIFYAWSAIGRRCTCFTIVYTCRTDIAIQICSIRTSFDTKSLIIIRTYGTCYRRMTLRSHFNIAWIALTTIICCWTITVKTRRITRST